MSENKNKTTNATVNVSPVNSVENSPGMETISELCPWCDSENTIEWDVKSMGMQFTCLHCGKPMMLCSMCDAAMNGTCDWKPSTNTCQKSRKED